MSTREAELQHTAERIHEISVLLKKNLPDPAAVELELKQALAAFKEVANTLSKIITFNELSDSLFRVFSLIRFDLPPLQERLLSLEKSARLAEEMRRTMETLLEDPKIQQALIAAEPVRDAQELGDSAVKLLDQRMAEVKSGNIIGPMSASKFLKHLEQIASRKT
ncbi:hypothetical protein HYR54_05385 [Candidatus Acetothermia bacterium]|nr:hypothetical protein [Candidatus Acetothermia bacterium]